MTPRVREILSWYRSENPGVLSHLARLFNHGPVAGGGFIHILEGKIPGPGAEEGLGCEKNNATKELPVDGFLGASPNACDPSYHFDLAKRAGFSALAAPGGVLRACAPDYPGEIPLILKISLGLGSLAEFYKNSPSFVEGLISEALELGCVAVGLSFREALPEGSAVVEVESIIKVISLRLQAVGLPLVVWGPELAQNPSGFLQTVAFGKMAFASGAQIAILSPPVFAKKVDLKTLPHFTANKIKVSTLTERTKYVMQSCFDGKRIVLFKWNEAQKATTLFEQSLQLQRGGSFGGMISACYRSPEQALSLNKSLILKESK